MSYNKETIVRDATARLVSLKKVEYITTLMFTKHPHIKLGQKMNKTGSS